MTSEPIIERKKKKSRWWIYGLVALLIVGAVVLYNNYKAEKDRQATISSLRTSPLARETLQSSISATGNVRPRQSLSLTWQSGGTVGDVEVAVGDKVEEGDILLSLNENKLPADLIQASLNKISASQALENLDANTALQRANLNNQIQTARNAKVDLETQFLNLDSRQCEDWRVDNLRNDYENALETYQNWPDENAWRRVQVAKTALDYCDPDVISQQLDNLQAQIDVQNQTIENTEADLDKIENGPDPDEVEKLELQLALAEKQLEGQYITAPFDGTVLSIGQKTDDQVSPGTVAVQVADLSELFVEVPISEVDIPEIQLDQTVSLFFDAYYDEEFFGVVSDISDTAERSTGIVNYTVTIKLDALDEQSDWIKPGMTAAVNILTSEKPNVLVVPAEAVVSRDNKQYVYVLRNGVPEMVEVTIGSYSSQQAEILETTIDEGEAIVINPPNDIMSQISNFAPGMR
ncbi:MAG: efflux RND transporter periplasmic adaptor subunit [Anaerolineaceae bacterium]|nr:efflux RND transporter periplasmic adaptor subunit [Anaerolineaceae bacterium]